MATVLQPAGRLKSQLATGGRVILGFAQQPAAKEFKRVPGRYAYISGEFQVADLATKPLHQPPASEPLVTAANPVGGSLFQHAFPSTTAGHCQTRGRWPGMGGPTE